MNYTCAKYIGSNAWTGDHRWCSDPATHATVRVPGADPYSLLSEPSYYCTKHAPADAVILPDAELED